MTVAVVFETHSISEDNEAGLATGWRPGRLSLEGRRQASLLGARRRDDGLDVVMTSDLERALETVRIAFDGWAGDVLHDWRLRECDYGEHTLTASERLIRERIDHLDVPYPGGESWREAIERVASALVDLRRRWDGCRVLVVGHTATRFALDHAVDGKPLEELVSTPFQWRPGWEYTLHQ